MVVVKYRGVYWWIFCVLNSSFLIEVLGLGTNGPSGNNDDIKKGNTSQNLILDAFQEGNVTVSGTGQIVDTVSALDTNVNVMTHSSTVTPRADKDRQTNNSSIDGVSQTSQKYSLHGVWAELCSVFENETYESEFTPKINLTSIKCVVEKEHSGLLKMTDLRQNILQYKDLNLKFSVEIRCHSQANISFSWPYKVYSLYQLKVHDCTIVDFLAERNSTYLDTIPDSLRVLHVRNSLCLIKLSILAEAVDSIQHVKKEFDCIHEETIEETSTRNISFDFIYDDEDFLRQILATGIKFMHDTRRISHVCDYPHLMSVDESVSKFRARYHADLMTEKSLFGELRTYNVSHTYIKVLKDQHLQWSRQFPKLEMLDLSHNDISKLYRFAMPLRTNLDVVTTIDLRSNQISAISVSDLEMFQSMPMVFYDLRNNPIDCNCSDDLIQLVKYIKAGKHLLISNLSDYSYIGKLRCKNPQRLGNVTLRSLTSEMICEPTVETEYFLVPVICLSVAIVILAVLLFMVLRFRQEITIILFTRFNIIIPCQTRENFGSDKIYDAFVSYSSNEEEYVEKLFEDLEKQPDDNSRPAFKFCMHHRDFVPGRTIFDNVTFSVESSRHTIILLSNHFIKSEYCLYEFQEAFRQSIMEKRRHLLIIMMEDMPEAKLPRDLRRCIKTFTYIRKDDFLFTERLVYALSVKQKYKTVVKSTTKHSEAKGKVDREYISKSTSHENGVTKATSDVVKSDIKSQSEQNNHTGLSDTIELSNIGHQAQLEKQQRYKKKVLNQNGDKLSISIKRVNDYNLSPIERKLNNKDLDYDRSLSVISQDTGYGSERGSICERLSPEVSVDIGEFPSQAVIC